VAHHYKRHDPINDTSLQKGGQMDIKKYLNKDIELSNDDIDIEKLTNDLRKGYVVETEITDRLSKEYEDKLAQATKESTTKIATLQNDFDSLTTKYNEAVNQNKANSLKVSILSNGFKSDDIEEVARLRTTMYQDITDDNEALNKVKERFKQVYFGTNVDNAPNESKMQTTPPVEHKPQITRNTSIKDLMKK
jgi:carbamoylphosphate synthase small subunit